MAGGADIKQDKSPRVEKRLRQAGLLIALGLLVQLLTFIRIHPLSFMGFAIIGCPLVLAGVVLYLYSIVSHQPSLPETKR